MFSLTRSHFIFPHILTLSNEMGQNGDNGQELDKICGTNMEHPNIHLNSPISIFILTYCPISFGGAEAERGQEVKCSCNRMTYGRGRKTHKSHKPFRVFHVQGKLASGTQTTSFKTSAPPEKFNLSSKQFQRKIQVS